MGNIKRMYLVDDDPDDRFFIRQAFEQVLAGVEVIEANGGFELLSLIHQKDSILASLILMDMNMPRMDGLETIAALRADSGIPFIPIVMISTSSNPSLIDAAYQSGVETFLSKPSTMKGFNELAEQLSQNYLA